VSASTQSAPVAGTGALHTLVDRLAAEFSEEPHRAEIAAAREDYFTRSGKVFEDDAELYERRATSFLEWYVIERPLSGGPPPVVRALARALASEAEADKASRRPLAWLAASHRSLFDLAAVNEDTVELEDVLGGARFLVHERRSTVGFEVGDLVEARICWEGRRVVFGKTFLFHPRDARDEAVATAEAALARGDNRDEVLFHLARLHVRWHRQGHAGAARVYRASP
jgi:hypothetical protein